MEKLMYTIQRTEYFYDADKQRHLKSDITLADEYPSADKANAQIGRYVEVRRKKSYALPAAEFIQHHAGQSVMFFKWGYVEFTRNGLISKGV